MKKNTLLSILVSLFLTLILLFINGCQNNNSLTVSDLRVENLKNPLGINTLNPIFSWKNHSQQQGAAQLGCQILVASERNLLDKKDADLWNSGKMPSSKSFYHTYDGEKLVSGKMYFWKVRAWDEQGKASPWSPPAFFSVGPLNADDWQASNIRLKTERGYGECPQLLKSFSLHETEGPLLLSVNSLGYHEIWLNGKKAGNGVLTPAVSQFNKRSLTNTYDVSDLVKKGRNELIIWLGSGWYTQGLPGVSHNGPVVKAQLTRHTGIHPELIVATDSTWVGRESSYTRHGNWRSHRFGGETVHGILAKTDLNPDDDPARPWKPVTVTQHSGAVVSPQMTEQNAITDTIGPIQVTGLAPDTFLVDMGKNLTGWFEITFPSLEKNRKITMEYCDHLNENEQFMNQRQSDFYIAAGEGREKFINKFNYHGFRYIRISNLPEKPGIQNIKAYLIQTDFEATGSFECSDKDLNQIHDMIHYTLRCLSLGGYLVDCPHIERLGYGGDGHASTQTAQTMFHMAGLYSHWLQIWADVMRENGSLPHTAPNPYAAGGGPYWCAFLISASWKTYLNYGDKQILEKFYPFMQKWLEYVDEYTVNGLLQRWPDTDYRNWYLGDWATPEGVDQTASESVDLVSNCVISVCLDQISKIARVLTKTEDSEFYSQKRERLNKTIHETFFDESNPAYATGSQIDLIYPLLAGVVPEKFIDPVTDHLMKVTETKYDGHLATGLVGIPVMMEWATASNEPDFIYSMLKKKGYPGYLHMIENDATTTWEHWNGHRSRIHNCYNGLGQWFYQAVGGIRPIDGKAAYSRFLIDPQVPEGITWAKSRVESPQGTILTDWKVSGDSLKMEIRVPVGSTAKLCIPPKNEIIIVNNEKIRFAKDTFNLNSGKHFIEYVLQ